MQPFGMGIALFGNFPAKNGFTISCQGDRAVFGCRFDIENVGQNVSLKITSWLLFLFPLGRILRLYRPNSGLWKPYCMGR